MKLNLEVEIDWIDEEQGIDEVVKESIISSIVRTVGDKVRVRAGPFPNKAAADKAAVRIQKILGVQASVAAKQ